MTISNNNSKQTTTHKDVEIFNTTQSYSNTYHKTILLDGLYYTQIHYKSQDLPVSENDENSDENT